MVGWVSFVTSWVWLCRYHCHLQGTPDLKFPQWWIAVTLCGLRSVPAPLVAVSSLRTSEGLSVCARFVVGATEFSVLLTYPHIQGRECEPGLWELGFLSLLSLPSAPAKLCPVSEWGLRPERGFVLCPVVAHCFVLVRIVGQEGFLSPSWSGGLLLLPLLQEQWLFAWALGWAGFLTISQRSQCSSLRLSNPGFWPLLSFQILDSFLLCWHSLVFPVCSSWLLLISPCNLDPHGLTHVLVLCFLCMVFRLRFSLT